MAAAKEVTPLRAFAPARCQTCPAYAAHLHAKKGQKATGICRMTVPVAGMEGMGGAIWPRVEASDWCMVHPDNVAKAGVLLA